MAADAGRRADACPYARSAEAPYNEKAPDDAGALTSELAFGSVLGDDRTGPVEAVDQRSRDRLVPAVGADALSRQSVAAVGQDVRGLGVVEGRTILGLHEPAGRLDAEDVQVVLDAAADEPAIAVVAVEIDTGGHAGQGHEVGLGEVSAPRTAVDVGENVRNDQPARGGTNGPRNFPLL